MSYTFGRTITGEFEAVAERVVSALAAEGFGILATIDVAATLQAKLGVTRSPYLILGACNPPLAQRAIDADPEIGALLPCNVVIRQDDDGVAVRFMDPAAVMALVGSPEVETVAHEARRSLERVAAAI